MFLKFFKSQLNFINLWLNINQLNLLNNKNSFTLFDRVKSEIIDEYDTNYNEIKKLGGFLTGNLDIKPSKEIVKIWEILKESKISELLKELTNKGLNEYDIRKDLKELI